MAKKEMAADKADLQYEELDETKVSNLNAWLVVSSPNVPNVFNKQPTESSSPS